MSTALYMVCFVVYAVIGILALQIDRHNLANRLFSGLCFLLMLWSALFVPMSLAQTAIQATFFRRLATFSWSIAYSLLIHFFIVLTRHGSRFWKFWPFALLHLPAVFCLYLYFWAEPFTAQDIALTPLGWAFSNTAPHTQIWHFFFNIYYVTYVLAGLFLLLLWSRKTPHKREQHQARIMIIGMVISMILGSITDVLLPLMGVSLFPPLGIVTILIPIGGIWYAMKKYQLMNLYPENAVMDILKIMSEGLIIFDQNLKIRQINRGASTMLGYQESEIDSKSIEDLFPDVQKWADLPGHGSWEAVAVSRTGQTIPVLMTASRIKDSCGDPIGMITIFQDISDIKTAQAELFQAHAILEQKVTERTYELVVLNEELADEIQNRKEMENQIRRLALHDALTGLPNRRLIYDRLGMAAARADRSNLSFALLFLDLDGFKKINDTLGHAMGDELLRQVAERLVDCIRKEDTVARVGGDEFLVLLPDIRQTNDLVAIARKILAVFAKPFSLGQHEIVVTTSIGGARYPQDGADIDALITHADYAMYQAKQAGKNRFFSYESLI